MGKDLIKPSFTFKSSLCLKLYISELQSFVSGETKVSRDQIVLHNSVLIPYPHLWNCFLCVTEYRRDHLLAYFPTLFYYRNIHRRFKTGITKGYSCWNCPYSTYFPQYAFPVILEVSCLLIFRCGCINKVDSYLWFPPLLLPLSLCFCLLCLILLAVLE